MGGLERYRLYPLNRLTHNGTLRWLTLRVLPSLGYIGPEASKPVMEGKGLLFKIYADIDVFDLEVNAKTVDEFVAIVKSLEPTFGGINLEDISAPSCFEI